MEIEKLVVEGQVNANRRFIIYSLARCGSTTLTRILNCIPGIQCAFEPFNLNNSKSPYAIKVNTLALDKDALALVKAVGETWNRYTGIKHVWQPPQSKFQKCPDLIEEALLMSQAPVIFLTRRNRLQRIVSFEMSLQTNIWGFFNKNDKEIVSRFNFKSLEIKSLLEQLTSEKEGTARAKEFLRNRGIVFIEIYYESLFDASISARQRFSVLANVIAFTGHYGLVGEHLMKAISGLLDANHSKLNSEATYRLIPNIEDVESKCGSEEDGWLFRDIRQPKLRYKS